MWVRRGVRKYYDMCVFLPDLERGMRFPSSVKKVPSLKRDGGRVLLLQNYPLLNT